MICPKCGTNNMEGSSFCIKCGNNIKQANNNMIDNEIETNNIQSFERVQTQPVYNQPVINDVQQFQQPVQQNNNQQIINNNNNTNNSAGTLNFIMFFVAIILKPFKSFNEEKTKLSNTKNSFITALIIAGTMTVINLVKVIFNTVRVASYNFKDGYTYNWEWANIKNIKWLEILGKNFLIYFGIIIAIAAVFYIGSLIIKKELKFTTALSISAASLVPYIIAGLIIAPLVLKVWIPLSTIFTFAGEIYTIIILYELINDELKLTGDVKIYFNLICLSILIIVGYYVYLKVLVAPVTSNLNNLLDYFK